MSSRLKAELAATCSTLGRFHKGEYIIEPECLESVKDLIRFLKRDNESHEIRRYLGEAKVLQNDLIHIVKSCPDDASELFDVTLRLLINLTTPTMLIYGEEMPAEKIGRNIYLSLIGYEQDYKTAFCDVEFWNKICGKLTNLFETDWAERSADDGIQIERILMLLRNVLQVPADEESLEKPDNDVTVHDKVLWALRQSQILELLLFVSSNENEEQYYLNLLEIFSLILRDQNPKVLAQCDVKRSVAEKNIDAEELVKAREMEKKNQHKYMYTRTFNPTFVLKGVKSLSNNDIVCHKPLEKVTEVVIDNPGKKRGRVRRSKISVETERLERRSAFSIRLFLKEFALEFLNSGFNRMMPVIKNRLDSGKSLVHDESYYFWALRFFLEFAIASDSDVALIQRVLSSESFHFVQTSMDNAFEHLQADKKKSVDWVKRIHLILKAYHSLLETLLWMDNSKNPMTRAMSREIKSEIFYVVEYREMTLHLLLRYDLTKFSTSYLRDLVETTHLFIKLLEEFSKQTKLVVQKVTKKKSKKSKKKEEVVEVETNEQKWDKIKDDVYDMLSCESAFPEIPPFDAASDIPIDDQKGMAMKKIQNLLHKGNIRDAVGLLRSARQVWPENEYFGSETMSVEDETMALQEICLADLGQIEDDKENENPEPDPEEEEEDEEEDEDKVQVVERDFDIMDFKKRLVNKKIVEGYGILLANYKKNSNHTNHCIIKLLYRIGWECCMPAMLYQASLFWTLLKIMKDKSRNYDEINTFTVNLVRKFRKHASKSPIVFLELLFWKDNTVALEIQHGYEPYEDKPKPKRGRKKKSKAVNEEEMPLKENGTGKKKRKPRRSRKKKVSVTDEEHESDESVSRNETENFETEPNLREFSEESSQISRKTSAVESDNDGDTSDVAQSQNSQVSRKNSQISGRTPLSSDDEGDISGKTKSQNSQQEGSQKTTQSSRRSLLSSDDENDISGKTRSQNSQQEVSQKTTQSSRRSLLSSDDEDDISGKTKSQNSQQEVSQKTTQRSHRSALSSDDENMSDITQSRNSQQKSQKTTQRSRKTVLTSDDEDMSHITQSQNSQQKSQKSTQRSRKTVLTSDDEDMSDITQSHNSQQDASQKTKQRSRRTIHSDDEDTSDITQSQSNKQPSPKISQSSQKTGLGSDNEGDAPDNSQPQSSQEVTQKTKRRLQRHSILNSDDEETSGNPQPRSNPEIENQDSNSQHSDNSYKKRTREETPISDASPGKDSNGSNVSKSKRRRFIGSDSDAETYQSDEEAVVVPVKNRRRLAVVDSDSDD